MSAFNDYCLVCDQLISDTTTDRLYCSEACKLNDTTCSNHTRLAATPESLIATPTLCPVDRASEESELDFDDDEDEELFELDYSPTCPIMMSTPRTFENEKVDYFSFNKELLLDHTAENNYKLWLNHNLMNWTLHLRKLRKRKKKEQDSNTN